jgi:hypothetical protein
MQNVLKFNRPAHNGKASDLHSFSLSASTQAIKGCHLGYQRTDYLKHGFGVRQIFSLINFNICLKI